MGRSGADLIWGLSTPASAPSFDIDEVLVEEQGGTEQSRDPREVVLQRASFRNYRSLREIDLDLDDITVLVGTNGSGKSNILDALARSVSITQAKPDTVFRGQHAYDRITTRRSKGGFSLTLQGSDGWGFEFQGGGEELPRFIARMGGSELTRSSLALPPMYRAFGGVVEELYAVEALAKKNAKGDPVAPSHSSNNAGRCGPSEVRRLYANWKSGVRHSESYRKSNCIQRSSF